MKSQQKISNKIFVSNYDTPTYPSGFDLVLYKDVDNIADNSLEEIFITDLLDNFSDKKIPPVLDSLIFKLKDKGCLHIQSLDFEQFNTYIWSRALDITNKNMLYDSRTNIQTMSTIEKMLYNTKNKTKILCKKYINGIEYYFKLEKYEDGK